MLIDGPWQMITRPAGIGPVYDFRADGSVTAISPDGDRREGSYRFPAPGDIVIELKDGEALRARYAVEEGILTLHAVGAAEPQRYFRAPLV